MHAKALVSIAIATLLVQVYAEPSEPSVHHIGGVARLATTPQKATKHINTNGGPQEDGQQENEQVTIEDLEEAIQAKIDPASPAEVDEEEAEADSQVEAGVDVDAEAEADADADVESVSPSAADKELVDDEDFIEQDDDFDAADYSSVSGMSSASYGGRASSTLSLAFSASSTPLLSPTSGSSIQNNARASAKMQNAKSSGSTVHVGMGATALGAMVVAAYSFFLN